MLPLASGADKIFRIERETDVTRVQVIVPVCSQVVSLIILIDKAPDTTRNGTRRAEVGAVKFASAASVKVTDHQLSLSQFLYGVVNRGHGRAIHRAVVGSASGTG